MFQEICKKLKIERNTSTTYHPRTDGQAERTNQWVEQFLRIYANYQQDDWVDWLPLVQYIHNTWKNETTGMTPFDLLMGYTPSLGIESGTSKMPRIEEKKDQLWKIRVQAQLALKHA